MSCTGSDPAPDPSGTASGQPPDADPSELSLQWPQDGADDSDFLVELNAWSEVGSLVDAVARHAWFTPRYERERDGLPAALVSPTLAPRAAELASGMWLARIRPNPYLCTHAFVCLDCHWVGSFDVVQDLDLLLERDLHVCGRDGRRRRRGRSRPGEAAQ